MSTANLAISDTFAHQPPFAAGPAAAPTKQTVRAGSQPAACRVASPYSGPTGWQVREEGEEYRRDRSNHPCGWTGDEDDEADLQFAGAARATAHPLHEAQRHLDDAVNLVGLLLDALEQDADSRAAQARTALELAVESLHKAHGLVDAQGLFMDEFDWEEPEEGGPPIDV